MNPARLSEDAIKTTWDSGHQSLPWSAQSLTTSFLPTVDFQAILNSEDPAAVAQTVDRRAMYLALANASAEDALEIMPLLSKEQFVAIIDYEGWHEGRLSIDSVIRWLDIYKNIGVDEMFKRFRELDDEYQVGLLSPYIELLDEEAYEALSHDRQDQFRALPCNTLWYRVKGDDKLEEFVAALILGGLGEDVQYTYSLLSHAAYVPPNEDEDLIKQFRNARLEEDGFALYEESRALFAPFDGQRYYEGFKHADSHSETVVQGITTHHWSGSGLFLDAVMGKLIGAPDIDREAQESLKISFVHLANMLASVCHIQPDDVSSLTRVLNQSRHLVSLGLEVLAGGDVGRGRGILLQERPKVIFQFGLSIVNKIRDDALDSIRQNDWPAFDKLCQYYNQLKFGALLWTIDTALINAAGFETTEMLKGLFNRFPMVSEETKEVDGANRIQFRPVGSVADIQKLSDAVATLRTCGRSVLEPVTGSNDLMSGPATSSSPH